MNVGEQAFCRYEWPDPRISRFPRELIGEPSNSWRTRAPRSPPGQIGREQFASGAAGDAQYSVAHPVLFPPDSILATNGCAGHHNLNMAPAGFHQRCNIDFILAVGADKKEGQTLVPSRF